MAPCDFARWLRDDWYRAPLWGQALRAHSGFEPMLQRRTDGVRPADRAASLERESVGMQPSLWSWLTTTTTPILFAAGADDTAYAPMAKQVPAASSASSASSFSASSASSSSSSSSTSAAPSYQSALCRHGAAHALCSRLRVVSSNSASSS